MSQAPAIHVSGLTKRFGARTVVDNIELTVQPGRIWGSLVQTVRARPPRCG